MCVILSFNRLQDPYFPESVQQLQPKKIQLKCEFLRNTEINMKPTLLLSPKCATEQYFFFSSGPPKTKGTGWNHHFC